MKEMKLPTTPIRFGTFEVDLQAGELRRQGFKVKLQEQPFQILIMLLERPNEVITREDLQKKLWPADTFVDAERGFNRAMNKLREALTDDADSPRFVETLPRRGYRFLASVESVGTSEPEGNGKDQLAIIPPDGPPNLQNTVSTVESPRRQVLPWGVAVVLAIVALIAFWKLWRSPVIMADRPFFQLDLELGPDKFAHPAISQDGMRIVFVSKGALAIRRPQVTKSRH